MKSTFPPAKAILFSVVGVLAGVSGVQAVNIANQGTAIIGTNTNINSGLGVVYGQAGAMTNINDGNLGTRIDTWNGNQGHVANTASFVGVTFATPRIDFVGSLSFNMACFFDGGWFGPNGIDPGALGVLTPTYLTAPTVQVTIDGGTTWTNVASTNNYVSTVNGTVLPVAFGPPSAPGVVTFNLTAPVTGINGIRLIGTEGGTASGGFLGAFELGVDASPVPEPSFLALSGLAGVALLRRRRVGAGR